MSTIINEMEYIPETIVDESEINELKKMLEEETPIQKENEKYVDYIFDLEEINDYFINGFIKTKE